MPIIGIFQNTMNFREKGGGGSLQSEKFVAKKRNIVFQTRAGGGSGSRPFGSFPKIHPKWNIDVFCITLPLNKSFMELVSVASLPK